MSSTPGGSAAFFRRRRATRSYSANIMDQPSIKATFRGSCCTIARAQASHASSSVDLMLPAAEKITPVLEGIGDDKIRVNSSRLDHPLTILVDQAIEIVAIEKKVMVGRTMRSAYWLNHDPSGAGRRGLRSGPPKRRYGVRNGVSETSESSFDVSRPQAPRRGEDHAWCSKRGAIIMLTGHDTDSDTILGLAKFLRRCCTVTRRPLMTYETTSTLPLSPLKACRRPDYRANGGASVTRYGQIFLRLRDAFWRRPSKTRAALCRCFLL
jgi:hypothetical protein